MQAREKIAERGRQIGLDFEGEVAALERAADWTAELRAVQDPNLVFPDYYTQPFHAYRDGNLCWEAALQVHTLLRKAPVLTTCMPAPVLQAVGLSRTPKLSMGSRILYR